MKKKNIKAFLRHARLSRIFLWGVGLILLYAIVGGSSGFYMFYKLWREKKVLQKEIQLQQKKHAYLKKEVAALQKNDPAKIEEVARKEYMMGAKDEIIIKVEDE